MNIKVSGCRFGVASGSKVLLVLRLPIISFVSASIGLDDATVDLERNIPYRLQRESDEKQRKL